LALIDEIRKLTLDDKIIVSKHANTRMVERGVSAEDIVNLILSGDIIEDYPDDYPCPSVLIFGFVPGMACHIVVGICGNQLRIITVYLPDEEEWINHKERKSKC
jgi:hypothetical protein